MNPGPQDVQLDFVGVGAARCGTTWLARCLAEHPGVQLPDRKELHYFNSDVKYEPSLQWLAQRFPHPAEGRLRGEFTPRYLISTTALDRIATHFPSARILVLLRDPVDRAWSQFRYFRLNKKKEPEPDFLRALDGFYHEDYVVKGRYGEWLQRLFERFPTEQVWIGRYDRIAVDPEALLVSLFRFLGIDEGVRPEAARRVINASRGSLSLPPPGWAGFVRWLTHTRVPPIPRYRGRLLQQVARRNARLDAGRPAADLRPPSEGERAEIFARYFAEDLERTEALLGRDLSDWRPTAPARRSGSAG